MIRAFFPAVLGIALLTSTPTFAAGADAEALVEAAAALPPGKYLWQDDVTAGPVSVLISIPDQKAYVYRGEQLVAVSTVSTGKEGNDTPVGSFTILQKKAMHHSNLYDDAPMPFMQRLTWGGVALHAGRVPGYPASHGCIRLPREFARKLYGITRFGSTIVVVAGEPLATAKEARELA